MTRTKQCVAAAATVWAGATLALAGGRGVAAQDREPNLLAFNNASGQLRTFSTRGEMDFANPFFQSLGTNGRSCVTCHQPGEAWTITPEGVQARFAATSGDDPIFRSNDGSNCEGAAPQSIAEKRQAYSLLLARGLIRVGLDVPAGAEFTIESIADPYDCVQVSNDASFYRRPLPSTNLRFLTAVMWDGRESFASSSVEEDLLRQANSATRGHAQAARDITLHEARQIVDFETQIFTAQAVDHLAGSLGAQGATGGPVPLSREPFFIGINDPVGLNPNGDPFDPNVFTLFNAWGLLASSTTDPFTEARRSVARGQAIFNTKAFTIEGVAGLNDFTFASGITVPGAFSGTCTVCHDTPNAGDHSVKAPLDIGISDPARATYLPVYTLRNRATRTRVRTTDPGRAMITGKWADVGKFKGPILRGLAARAPYFHNGLAATLEEAVEFYDTRFRIGLTPREKADLVAFLRAL